MKRCIYLLIIMILFFMVGCDKKDNVENNDQTPIDIDNRPETEEIESNQGIALINCFIIDGTGSNPINNGVILLKNGKIEAVGAKEQVTIPTNYIQKDMKGYTVLPGFINSHVHKVYSEVTLNKFLKSGITTVRALSNSGVPNFIELKNGLNQNPYNATIIQSTPIISTKNGYGSVFVDSVQKAEEVVQNYVNQDVDIIKFSIENFCQGRTWTVINQEQSNAIVNTAHANNKRVSVHITWARNIQQALDANVDELAHMVADYLSQELIDKIVAKGVYFIPTLELWRGVSNVNGVWYDDNAILNLNKFYLAGGKIAMGTDYQGYICEFDDGFPITEILMMKEAGMTNMDIIVSSTKHAAIVCDKIDQIGTLEVGKQADIFVVKGNPLEDLNVFLKPYLVIHQGKVILNIKE